MAHRYTANLLVYVLAVQPTMFFFIWANSEASKPVHIAVQRLGYYFGAYIALFLVLGWTASVIPVAYLIERYAGSRMSQLTIRRTLVAGCALASYASTLMFAYPLALHPPMAAILLAGGALYGSLFRLRNSSR